MGQFKILDQLIQEGDEHELTCFLAGKGIKNANQVARKYIEVNQENIKEAMTSSRETPENIKSNKLGISLRKSRGS
tara:strand:- start:1799 stop:2026 length:228 start_codon:yes stop_codon:yes gene_type:complete